MERLPGKIEFVYGKEYLELKWNSVNTSPEMVIDAIDSFGPIFFNYFESSYVNFLVTLT